MPRIQEYISPEASRGLNTGPLQDAAHRAEIRGRAAGDLYERGFEALGSGIEQLGQHIGQQQSADYLTALNQQREKEGQDFEQFKQAHGTDPDFTKQWLDHWRESRGDFNANYEGGLWGTGAQQYADKLTSSDEYDTAKEAGSFQIGVERDKLVATADTATQKLGVAAANDPLNLQTYLDRFETDVKPLLPPEHQATETVRLHRELADAAGGGLADKVILNPNATAADADSALKVLTDESSPLAQNMSEGKRGELETKLLNFKYTMASTQTTIAEQQLPSIYQQIKTSGSTDAYQQGSSLIAGHMPTSAEPAARRESEIWKAKHQRELDDAMAEGRVTSGLMDKSDNDLNALKQEAQTARDSATTDEGRRTAEATLNAIGNVHTLRDAEFNRDPAAYATNHSPAVGASAQAFAQNPNPQTWGDYAAKQTGYQQQIKGAGYVPHLLTKEMSADVSAAVNSITDQPNGTQVAGQKLAHWASITGGNWPNVARELMDNHVIDQDQYAAAQLYEPDGTLKASAAGLIDPLLSASRMNDKQRFDLHGLGEHQARAVAVKALQPLSVSMANIPNAAPTISAYTTALTHLMQVRGKVSQDEATDIANRMVLDEYDFRDNGTLRVPKSAGDTAAIGKGAERMRNELGPYEIDVPKSASGLGPGDQRANYISRLETNAHWYSTPDGKGATLYPSPGASTPVTVKGKPLTLSWKQLQDMGR